MGNRFSSRDGAAPRVGQWCGARSGSASCGGGKRIAIRRVASGLVLPLLLGCSQSAAEPAADIAALNWDGAPFRLHDQRGKVALLFFGFTHCPDICPGSFSKIRGVYGELTAAEREGLAVVFVSVDPERDTREKLAVYVPAFDPAFVGLHLDRDSLARTAGAYGVVMEKRYPRGRESDDYSMDHTSTFFLIDRAGNLRERIPFNVEAGALRAALERLLEERAPEPRRSSSSAAISVEDARLRITPGEVAAIYFTVTNGGGRADRLVSAAVSPDLAERIEMHETVVEDGVARMLERPEGYRVPPRGAIALEEGGRHLMVFGLREEVATRGGLDLELNFERAGTVRVHVPVDAQAQGDGPCCLEK